MHAAAYALLLISLAACGDDPKGNSLDSGDVTDELPPPGPLQAGFARERIPAPVGMGTVGYGPNGSIDSSSPYSSVYPSTRSVHGHPEIKVAIVSRGDAHEVVFVRLDTVGVFQQFRRAVVLEYEARTGKNIDNALVMGATHTHAGPGRIIDGGGIYDIIADRFFPDFYERFVSATVDAIEDAYLDLAPASLATATAQCTETHSDRRCEDGEADYTNGQLPLLVIERGGQIDTVIGSYAVHGTVLTLDDLTLSQDVYGPIEHAIEDGFDHPVQALMFNSWGADMSPEEPEVEERRGVDQGDFDRMEKIGVRVGQAVHDALAGSLEWTEEPEVRTAAYRPPINRDVIGYAEEEFPYPHGAVYCERDSDCDAATEVADLDKACLPFNEQFPAPQQTVLTHGRVGAFTLVTFPGEPGTALAERVMTEIRSAPASSGEIFFMGYAQDYLGYSIEESDWWQGGYEASGALWGPRQGEYLADRVVEAAAAYADGGTLSVEVNPITPFEVGDFDRWVPEVAIGSGEIITDVAASYGRSETVQFVVTGDDPWLGTPTARLLTSSGDPLLRPNGLVLTGDDNPFHWTLDVEPAYEDVDYPTSRTFAWHLSMPAGHTTAAWPEVPAGMYTLEITVPTSDGPSAIRSMEFEIYDDL